MRDAARTFQTNEPSVNALELKPAEPAYQCNGETVSMARFYAVACDPARHVAVEACAGAGKTWMLVSRIVRALLSGCAPHEILAISFTRRAAGEMRERLHQWLAEFARAEPHALIAELVARGFAPAAAQAAAEPLRGLYRQVLHAARPVQILTFHGWFWTLLAGAPLSLLERLGLPADADLVEDESELVARLWPRFYQRLIEQPPLRADHLALVKRHGRFQTQKALEGVLQRRIEFGLADALGVPERSVDTAAQRFAEFTDWPRPLDALFDDPAQRALLGRAAKALGTGAPSFAKKGVELEQALAARDGPGLIRALLTDKDEPRKFSDKVVGLEFVRQAQEQVVRAQRAEAQQEAHEYQQRMTRLSRLLLAEFAALKRERGVLDMADIEHAAQHLLGDELLGGFLQERLDARVRHLLIDEFQDTNPLQWQALSAWLSGYVGSGGGLEPPRVFIVGDPKQSIYRFRRAEPQVFRAAQAFLRDGLGGDLLACDHTRRNAPALLAALNDVMSRAQADGAYDGFRAHSTASTDAGGVLELPPIARDESAAAAADATPWRDTLTEPRTLPEDTLQQRECRQAARWIARCIAEASPPIRPSDVMVLARRRAPLGVLQAELRALGVAATQPEQRRLADAPEVQDIVALLDALVSSGHDLSTARMLRSPLFSVSDDALVQIALAKRANPTLSWFELLLNPKQEMQEMLASQPDLPEKLRRWKGWLDTQSPHDALAAIYHDADVLARFAAAAPVALRETVLANLRAVLSAALRIDAARYATPYALVRALKSRFGPMAPASSKPDAVGLLTVHGAKGLEAPLVLLLDTEAQLGRKDAMGVLIDWPGEASAPRRFAFLVSESHPSDCCIDAVAAEQAARAREELNALYVAMTRARSRLVLSSVAPARAAATPSWRSRIVAHAMRVELDEAPLPAIDEAAHFVLHELPGAPPVAASTAVSTVAGPTTPSRPGVSSSSRTGTGAAITTTTDRDRFEADLRLHAALRRLLGWAAMGADAVPPAQVAAITRDGRLTPTQARHAAALAQAVLTGPSGWAWDAAQVDWQQNDLDLVSPDGAVLRLDRLVRRADTGQWWVFDYALSLQAEQDGESPEARADRLRAAVQLTLPGAVVRVACLASRGDVVEIE